MRTPVRVPSRSFFDYVVQFIGRGRSASPEDVEKAELTFYASYLRRGMIVFDVGAYIGIMTLLFSKLVREEGEVHAFEPTSTAFERLKAICHVLGLSNVTVNRLALAEEEGVKELYVYESQYLSWSSLAQRSLENYGIHVKPVKTEKVTTTTIDSYCQKHGITRIDLLKIDAEGAEYQVLLGARRMLKEKQIRCCIFEFGQTTFDIGNNVEQIETYLKQMGYRIRNVVKGDPVFPGRRRAETARFSMHVVVPK